jgi:CRP-like cAMP-binding protein
MTKKGMDKAELILFLTGTNQISRERAEAIAEHFKPKSIARNQFLLTEGQLSDEYFFMRSGFLRAFAYDTDGNDVTTNFYIDNQVVFEVSSFFNRTISKENIQALTDCEGWYITYAQLNMLFHSMQEFREFGRSVLVKGFAALKVRMLSMITETAEERYAHLLQHNPKLFEHVPLKYIASYLGITDSSLSRIRKELTQKQ